MPKNACGIREYNVTKFEMMLLLFGNKLDCTKFTIKNNVKKNIIIKLLLKKSSVIGP